MSVIQLIEEYNFLRFDQDWDSWPASIVFTRGGDCHFGHMCSEGLKSRPIFVAYNTTPPALLRANQHMLSSFPFLFRAEWVIEWDKNELTSFMATIRYLNPGRDDFYTPFFYPSVSASVCVHLLTQFETVCCMLGNQSRLRDKCPLLNEAKLKVWSELKL